MKLRWMLGLITILAIIGALAWGAVRLVRATSTSSSQELPTTKVKRGKVVLTVAARGELQGGNSEMLTAPMIGGGTLALTDLREPGELVKPGDVVAQFDTTEQEYRLKEAICPRPSNR
jgi:multidrug efflux pump subunit AcrA (membrane-fusion protein)